MQDHFQMVCNRKLNHLVLDAFKVRDVFKNGGWVAQKFCKFNSYTLGSQGAWLLNTSWDRSLRDLQKTAIILDSYCFTNQLIKARVFCTTFGPSHSAKSKAVSMQRLLSKVKNEHRPRKDARYCKGRYRPEEYQHFTHQSNYALLVHCSSL